MYCLFDTETIGIPRSFNAPPSDLANWATARMVQIAWIEYDEHGNKTASHDYLIKPDGFTIPLETIKIHRITNERANEKGIPIKKALALFREAIARNKYLVAHNIQFDQNVTGSEFIRAGQDNPVEDIFKVCTMKLTTNFVRAKGAGGRMKWPTLSELHMKLFGKAFVDAHDALVDTEALGRCFFELQKRGVLGFKEAAENKAMFEGSKSVEVAPEELLKPVVNFGLHSFFSLLRGASSAEEYIQRAKELGHTTLVLTDRGNLSGSLGFYQRCKEASIKPIIGCEMSVNDNIGHGDATDEGASYIQKIIVKDKAGFTNLNKLLFLSHTDGFRGGESRITTDWLIENREGLMVSASGPEGYIADLVVRGRRSEAETHLVRLKQAFGEDLFIEIKFSEAQEQKPLNEFLLSMALKHDILTIVDNDVHYATPEGKELQDTVYTIGQHGASIKKGAKLFERRNLFYPSRKNYMEFNRKFGYFYPEKVIESFFDNSLILAERCNFDFEFGVEKYPAYEPTQDVIDYFKTDVPEEIIYKMSDAKLRKKLKDREKRSGVVMTDEQRQVYFDRLKYELDVIKSKRMLDYFLVNWEILRDYRSHGFETGSARGSGAGCLLAWALDITKIDPLNYGLYFERFLNPTRSSPPDLDIDVMSGTDDVIDAFLLKKYGKERIMAVGTYSTFNEKGCIKDVVRAHLGADGTGEGSEINIVTNEMPEVFGKSKYPLLGKTDFTLQEWIENYPSYERCSPTTKRWLEDPSNETIIKQTLALQGHVRGFGQHAAGVVITPKESWHSLPTGILPKQQSIISAFQEADGSSKDLSGLGILKLDLLKLSTMNVIMDAIQMIKENTGKDITDTIMHIDEHFDDKNLYAELRLGLNHGIFQFESPGINSLIRGIGIESFDEVVAANALFRPGPMSIDAHTDYIHNKFNPTEIHLPHPALEPILAETNGVMIFQEQVQFIANQIGGMSLGDGDMLRRYMDKAADIIAKTLNGDELSEKEKSNKDYQNYLKYWDKLLKGAAAQGHSDKDVDKIGEYMVKYLGYSFNKCLTSKHLVITETRGEVNILDVHIGEKVLGYDPDTHQKTFSPVKAIHKNGKKEVYRVSTKHENEFECTLDHKILTYQGMQTLEFVWEHDLRFRAIMLDGESHWDNVMDMESIGEVDTYDLEIDSPHHNFYANGVCVSNSHSVAYGFIAMQTLYLKHYHPAEFYAALLNNAKPTAKEEKVRIWMENTIASAISKGIAVKTPSRGSKWLCSTTGPMEVTLGFSMIKGFGEVAHQELMELIAPKKKPLEELSMTAFFELPFSKFNKSAFSACLKAGVFDDWSNSREYLLFLKTKKKKKTIDPQQLTAFDMETISIGTRMDDTKYLPTTDEEKLSQFIEVCGFDMRHIERIANIKRSIEEKAAKTSVSIEPITNFNGDGPYYFFLNDIRYLKTKTQKDYLELTVGDGISKTKLRIFEPMMEKISSELERNAVYMTQFVQNDKGFKNIKRGAKFKKIVHAYASELA